MQMEYMLFVVGFFLLIFGAEWLIDGVSKLASRLGVSSLIIGLTVVAFGTSLPELVVSLYSAANDAPELAVGDILGSNIANTLLVLGVVAVITPIYVHRKVVWREVSFNIAASIILLVLVAGEQFLGPNAILGLSRFDGIILVSYFALFLIYTFRKHHLHALATQNKPRGEKKAKISSSIGMTTLGIIGLVVGGQWIVNGAISLSEYLGVSEDFVGLTIVALGTSMPELATSIAATRRKKVDIAVGNVVGSNLFNILWVLGLTAVVQPIEFSSVQVVNTALVALASITLFALVAVGKRKHQLSRIEGLSLLSFYAFYLIILYYLLTLF